MKSISKEVAWELINSIENGEIAGDNARRKLETIKNEWSGTDLSREAERLIIRLNLD